MRGNCRDCGFSDGAHIRDCPSTPKRGVKCTRPYDHETYPDSHAANKDDRRGPWGPECPVHGPTAYAASRAEPYPVKHGPYPPGDEQPKPDSYVSPHSLNATGEKPVRVPVYEEVPTGDPNLVQLVVVKEDILYPHNTWINARESYAKGWDTLENVLQYVTEDNPPPGPPIPVYKPAAEPEKPPLHRRGVAASVIAWCVFTGLYIPTGEHGHYQLTLFIILASIWLAVTWALRRVR